MSAENKILALLEKYPMLSTRNIVRSTKLSFTTVRNTLNRLRDEGKVERTLDMGRYGRTIYVWYV